MYAVAQFFWLCQFGLAMQRKHPKITDVRPTIPGGPFTLCPTERPPSSNPTVRSVLRYLRAVLRIDAGL